MELFKVPGPYPLSSSHSFIQQKSLSTCLEMGPVSGTNIPKGKEPRKAPALMQLPLKEDFTDHKQASR